MQSRLFLILTLVIGAGAAIPAESQTINNVLQSNSYSNAVWNDWATVYGSSLPTGTNTYVRVTFPVIYSPGGLGGAQNIISSTSAHQTYWYVSATQLNFFLFSGTISGGQPLGGCWNGVCNSVTVCDSGLCSNLFNTTFNGNP